MNRLRPALALVTILALWLTGAPAALASPSSADPGAGLITATGILNYEERLETPHLTLDSWALLTDFPDHLRKLVGSTVTVRGTRFAGSSILMRPQLVVSTVELDLEGTLQVVAGPEAPHYELDGWVLADDLDLLHGLGGSRLRIRAALFEGLSLFMQPMLTVLEATPAAIKPRLVVTRGRMPVYRYGMVRVSQGHLLLPLGATLAALGGEVTWQPESQTVLAALDHRTLALGSRVGDQPWPVAPIFLSDEVLVPIAVFRALGLEPVWLNHILCLQ